MRSAHDSNESDDAERDATNEPWRLSSVELHRLTNHDSRTTNRSPVICRFHSTFPASSPLFCVKFSLISSCEMAAWISAPFITFSLFQLPTSTYWQN